MHENQTRKWSRSNLARSFATLLLLVAPVHRAWSQTDQIIYDDARQNGWQDYGWAVLDYNNTSPVHGGTKSIRVTAGPYQALSLHHDAFNTAGFTNLSFWIHGGSAGGQSLQVQVVTNGSPLPPVNLPALTTNWQLITLSLGALGAANRSDVDGFWIQNRVNAGIPAFYVDDIRLTAVPPPSTVNLSVDAAQVVRTVDARFFGLNAAIWDSVFDTPNTVALLREIDHRVLRFPGGSLSDEYHWASNTSRTNTWQWATSFSKFTRVATNLGAQVFITVNYGSGTPEEAAAWVRHANVTNALGFRHWEVGNENYGSWEYDTNNRPHDAWTYANRFQNYFNQMKAADPSIKIGAVIVHGEDSYANYTDHPATNARTLQVHHGWTPVLLARLKQLGVTPDFVIYHRYEQNSGTESDTTLLGSAVTWSNEVANLRQHVTDYLGAAGANVELIVTENNSVSSLPGKQSTSLVNGLYLADSVGQVLQTEVNSLVWWALRNSQEFANNNSAALHGWRPYGDYGITDGSNPSTATNRYPTFYVAKLLKWFARGGDRVVRASSDYPGLSAYAVQRTNGFLTLLVINKAPTNVFNANISLAGFGTVSNALAFSYGLPQDEAARTNNPAGCDIARTNFTVAGTNFTRAFPPYSVTVLALTADPVVTVRPLTAHTNGLARLQIRGLPDVRYVLHSTSNFVAWPARETNTLTAEFLDWTDPLSAGRSNLFYRALWLP